MSDGNSDNGSEVIKVRSRFASLAKRPGGMSIDDAVAAAEEAIQEKAAEYPAWLNADLTGLLAELDIAGAATRPEIRKAAIGRSYERACRIRDLGSTFEFFLVTDVADQLCELLLRMVRADRIDLDQTRLFLGSLQLVGSAQYRGVRPSQAGGLVEGLQKIVNRYPRAVAEPDEG
jgi:hypothetical protein